MELLGRLVTASGGSAWKPTTSPGRASGLVAGLGQGRRAGALRAASSRGSAERKDAGEIARIAAAAAIADAALATVRPMLEERPTEAEVALALDTEMRRLGAEAPAFETIVAAGPTPPSRTTTLPGARSAPGSSSWSISGPESTGTART